MRRLLHVLPVLAATILLSAGAIAAPSVGSMAPDFTARALTGKTFRLSQFRGKSPLIVNFFSTT